MGRTDFVDSVETLFDCILKRGIPQNHTSCNEPYVCQSMDPVHSLVQEKIHAMFGIQD